MLTIQGTDMNKIISFVLGGVITITVSGLAACGDRAQLETCNILEIEDAEVEVDVGDVDIERGEVEMVCGDDIVDVTWGQFRQKLRINPGQYKNNVEQFKRMVSCVKDERDRSQEVFCQRPGSSDKFVALKFSYDD
jgi:hypothetical protein